MRQVQVPWPQAADADTLSSLASATFRSAVQDQPFRISRVVLALQYCSGNDTAPPASEKRKRGSSVPLSPQPAQQSILHFVSNSTPAAAAMQDNAAGAAAASGVASRAAALAARGGRLTLQSFFAPSRHADGNIAADCGAAHSTAGTRGSSECARDVGGEGGGRGGSVGCERPGAAGVRDGADQKEQTKISRCERVDVVVID